MSMLTTALLQNLKDSDTPDPIIAGLKEHLVQIEDAMMYSRRESSRLKTSGEYSKTGVINRVMEVLQATAATLDKIESSAHGYDDHIRQLEDGMKPDVLPGDSTLAFLQGKEIRERLADMDPLELQIKYMDACGDGGLGADLIAAACENDPLPRLSEEVLQEGRIQRARRKSPEKAKLLADLIRTRSVLKDALSEARGDLEKAGLPKDDWLMKVAKGEIVPD